MGYRAKASYLGAFDDLPSFGTRDARLASAS